jgi:hypothetical protein
VHLRVVAGVGRASLEGLPGAAGVLLAGEQGRHRWSSLQEHYIFILGSEG